MDRGDNLLIGCGGAGNKLADSIVLTDQRFQCYFINSSKTDIESLKNYDNIMKNYICTSTNNGTGRNRLIGKRYAGKNGLRILDNIEKYDQGTIFLISSLGGGSGSSTVDVLLNGLEGMKEEGYFNKVINFIGILPRLDSPDIILQNTIDTWNEIMSYNCINNMIFIDNNNTFNGEYLDEDTINERFAELFDSIFDIPNSNGTKFDSGNLGNIINSKGCTYIYNLPSGCENIDEALKIADNNSILARMYKTKDIMVQGEDNSQKIKCGYIGTSFADENYTNEEILNKYQFKEENYYGDNEDENLLIVTGMLPPYYSIQIIEAELEDRKRNKVNKNDVTDFSQFVSSYKKENKEAPLSQNKSNKTGDKNKTIKKVMKKNLFDMY